MTHDALGMVKGRGTQLIDADETFLTRLGFTRHELQQGLIVASLDEVVSHDDAPTERVALHALEFTTKHGSRIPVLLARVASTDGAGGAWSASAFTPQVPAAHAVHFEDRELALAHERLAQAERQFAEAQRIAGAGSWEWDAIADKTTWSDEMFRIYDRDPALGAPGYEALAPYHQPEDLEILGQLVTRALTTGEPYELDTSFLRRDGSRAWVTGRGEAVRSGTGEIIGLRGATLDITRRREAELALSVRTDLYAMLARTNDAVNRCASADELFQQLCDIAVSSGRFPFAWIGVLDGSRVTLAAHAGTSDRYIDTLRSIMAESDVYTQGVVGQAVDTGRSFVINDFMQSPITDGYRDHAIRLGVGATAGFPLKEHGRVRAVVSFWASTRGFFTEELIATLEEIAPTISFALDAFAKARERDEVQEALRQSEERLRLALSGGHLGIYDWDLSTDRVVWSSTHYELFGYERDATFTVEFRHFADRLHPDDSTTVIAALKSAQETRSGYDIEYRITLPTGDVRWIHGAGEYQYAPDGTAVRMLGTVADVTARKVAEVERQSLEDQLRQSQKMEAVGQLAGGVAHDFNNLLTVINGYSDLLLAGLPAADDMHEPLSGIRQAGQRAATLTQQLLAFSRRAIVTPEVVDVNDLVGDCTRMLRRLLEENVSLTASLSANACMVRIDRGQFEQVMMNLAVNARDAMPEGGRLTIATSVVPVHALSADAFTGPWVRISVTDTGVGMTDDVKARVFEPFFTTKAVGKGTGLGLSMVHGIITQAGGTIEIESAPDRGSAFTIWLPQAVAQPLHATPESRTPAAARGTETILLVEDEPAVRRLARRVLEMQGYSVLEAENGAAAVQLAEQHPGPIDLLLTDVVMPELSGAVAADAIRERRAQLKVLYVSGYNDAEIPALHDGAGVDAFLPKPYGPGALAAKVREMLDAPRV